MIANAEVERAADSRTLTEKSIPVKTRHFSMLIREGVRLLAINTPNTLIVGGSLTNNLEIAQLGWFLTLPRVLHSLHRKKL